MTSRWRRCRSIAPQPPLCSAASRARRSSGLIAAMPAADTDALIDLIVRLSHFAADHADDIAEIDLNPVIVHSQG